MKGEAPEVMIEPYRIKVVEKIRMTSPAERKKFLKEAGYNTFKVRSDDVIVDLLTDSGTSAMSDNQWAGLMLGDEAYASCRNFFSFQHVIQDLLGFEHVLPTHQGRAADHVMCTLFVSKGKYIPGNMHFDSSKLHTELLGGTPVDLVYDEAYDPNAEVPFKGNTDNAKLKKFIEKVGVDQVPMILITITNNSGGGQPVSMANLRETAEIAKHFRIPLFLDIARFAENAYFIKTREKGYENKSIREIVREMMSFADGCTMSCKKDGLVNIGGFFAMRDYNLYVRASPLVLAYEGFVTYGGLAGRDLEAVARGLTEVVEEDYLRHRIGQVRHFGERLMAGGVPLIKPIGGHAVYIDVKQFYPHIPQLDFPGIMLASASYIECGMRGSEIGTLWSDRDPVTHENRPPKMELFRLAVPRRMYTQSHLDYAADGVIRVFKKRNEGVGFDLEYEPPVGRIFLSKLRPKKNIGYFAD